MKKNRKESSAAKAAQGGGLDEFWGGVSPKDLRVKIDIKKGYERSLKPKDKSSEVTIILGGQTSAI